MIFLLLALQAATPPIAPDAATLFKQKCSVCHEGDANPRATKMDVLKTRTPQAIITALVSGAMRVQGSRLSGPERRMLAEYISGKALEGDVTGSALGRCGPSVAPFNTTSNAAWNGWGVTPANTRFQTASAAGLTAADVPRLKVKWALGFPDATIAWAQPTVVGGRVFVGSQNGTVYSLDAKTGCIAWTFSASGGVRTAVAVGRNLAYFGDTSANVYALDAVTGKQVWRRKVDDHPLARVTGSPVFFENRVYVALSSYEEAQGSDADYECCTFRGSVQALDATTGAQVWKTYTIADKPVPRGKSANGVTLYGPSGASIWSAPTIDAKRGLVYAGTGNTYSDPPQDTSDAVVAFDLKTGKIAWTKQITPADTFISACRTGSTNPNCPAKNGPDFDFGNSPILTKLPNGRDAIVIGQKSGIGFALDPDKRGEILWQYRAGAGGALGGIEWGSAVDGEHAYFPVSDISSAKPGGLHAVELATGERAWYTPPPAPKCGATSGEGATPVRGCNAAQSAAISAIPGVVFSGSNDGALRAYSSKDGAILWEFDTNRDFPTVNGVPAKGASMQGPGPTIAGGMLYANSGYGGFGGRPGNVLLAFAPDIDTSVVEKYRADLLKQAADPAMKREGGTQPQDWPYTLPPGVTTRQVTYYSDGVACFAKLFFPPGFSAKSKLPAVVLGHGFNGLSIGIEKYGARFAERGLIAMVIDYRTYGYSSGLPTLLEDDPSTDAKSTSEKTMRVQFKRTRLNAFKQGEDYRAAISYIQGEPGVDRDRIGIWGSSYSGGVVVSVAGEDARVKAVVSQVISVAGRNQTGPVALSAAGKEDEIKRARLGQGAEIDGGFSFRTKIDMETNQTGREHRPWQNMQRAPLSTAILWLPAEKDELSSDKSPTGAFEASKNFQGVSQVVEIPAITHFQAYNGPAFEVTSTLAANWFLKYLAEAKPSAPSKLPPPPPPLLAAHPIPPIKLADGITTKDVHYFDEGIACYGRLYLPPNFDAAGKAAAVVLAPGWGETHESLDRYAAALAAKGIVAMSIDYRGWGKSGAYLYTVDRLYQDDRFRMLQTTANMRMVRRRIIPEHQVADIRAALAYLAGEPGVDASRIGLLGEGFAGGHVIAVAAIDSHMKAGVSVAPLALGHNAIDKVQAPPTELLAADIKSARTGVLPDSRYGLWEYQPYRLASQVPKTTSLISIDDPKDVAAIVAFFAEHL